MRLSVLPNTPRRPPEHAPGGRDAFDSVDPTLAALAADLRRTTRAEVRFGDHDRGLYSTDASLYQVQPLGVAVPVDASDALDVVARCIAHAVPVLPRGGGTSLAGQCTSRAVVLDLSGHLRSVHAFDPASRTCTVDPGITVDDINRDLTRRAAALKTPPLFFAPDPATSAQCAIGGCIGNNAAGARSIRYGRTSENIAALDVAVATTTGARRLTLGPGAGRRDPAALRLAQGVLEITHRCADLIRARFPRTIRRNAGYGLDLILAQIDRARQAGARLDPADLDLTGLLCGSEGTLAVTLGATLKLHPVPRARGLAVASFATLEHAIAAVRPILDLGAPLGLSAVELLDDVVLDAARNNIEYRGYVDLLPGANADRSEPKAVLYIEFSAFDDPRAELDRAFAALRSLLADLPGVLIATGPRDPAVAAYTDAAAMLKAWKLRKAGEPLLHGLPGRRKPVTFVEDNAVPVERLAEFVARFKDIVARHGTRAAYWAHASVGVLHVRPMVDLHDPADRDRMVAIAIEVADLARDLGGVMSGEHGDGRVRGPLLERFFGPDLMLAFREVKRLFDPLNLLNPGNIVDPGPPSAIVDNLRIARIAAALHADDAIDTHFEYHDQHGLVGAAEQCNGSGLCRKTTGGTMCPSYRATLDERHSPRGRANALRLALTGQLRPDVPGPAWNDPDTLETLDLCLSCKACKAECPSNVDIARLKAEYAAQSYRVRGGPPLAAFVFGHVRALNRLGALTPGLANSVNGLGPTRYLAERLLGISRRRTLPRFERSLYARWRRDPDNAPPDRPRVLLFADCFTAYNEPHIGLAARTLLDHLGVNVDLGPPQGSPADGLAGFAQGCCGRALISTGLLDDARATIDRTLELLRPAIDDPRVDAVLFAEPSCLSAVSDDWLQLKLATPLDVRRRLAAKARLVEDYAATRLAPLPGAAARTVVLHAHCHQKALWGAETSARALSTAGFDVTTLDSGCCGMAGAFGYQASKVDLAGAIGELSVFPPVRAASHQTIIAAPGTSCRHQIRDHTGREALHPVEILAQAVQTRVPERTVPAFPEEPSATR